MVVRALALTKDWAAQSVSSFSLVTVFADFSDSVELSFEHTAAFLCLIKDINITEIILYNHNPCMDMNAAVRANLNKGARS